MQLLSKCINNKIICTSGSSVLGGVCGNVAMSDLGESC